MIIIKIKGGLGNQMFQYAFGRKISLMNNNILKLDINGFKYDKVYKAKYSLDCFNIDENIANEKDLRKARIYTSKSYIGKILRLINKIAPYNKKYLIREKQLFVFDSKVLKKYTNAYIDGSWQNEKYFKDIEDIIRKDFKFTTRLNGINIKLADKIMNSNSVGIHMRNYGLTNSVKASKKDLHEYGIMSSEYYKKAVEYIEKTQGNLNFFIFSDDINMAKNIIKCKYPTSFVTKNKNKDYKDYEDLCLMSLCKHQIISNSTFSWWAAWLNNNPDKIVIVPKKWFNDADYDTSDLIPKEWKKIY